MRTSSLLIALLASGLFACGGARAPTPHLAPGEGGRAWQVMTGPMLGAWEAPYGERTVHVSYTLVSNGSALLETWRVGDNSTVSVYHRVEGGLGLTHYCGQGNQAVLRATRGGDEGARFERVSVTGWSPDSSVLDALELTMDGDALMRTETYVDHAGEAERSTLRFVRPAADAAETEGGELTRADVGSRRR